MNGNTRRCAGLISRWRSRWFPDRQIYIRTDGRVQFYTVSSSLQVMAASLGAVFLAWVAFTTVVVVFKDRIMAAEDRRFQQTQAAFEDRIADLQMSFDEVVGAASEAQAYADQKLLTLKKRQQTLYRAPNVHYAASDQSEVLGIAEGAHNALRDVRPPGLFDRTLRWLAKRPNRTASPLHHPSLDGLAHAISGLRQLSRNATGFMSALDNSALQGVLVRKQLIAGTGIDVERFLHKLQGEEGMGGPEIPLDDVQVDGIGDRNFSHAYLRAEADLAQLTSLRMVLSLLPIATPLGSSMERSSGFGPRLDPFSGRYAFHPGVDFAGPAGAPVLATAGGVVSFAGRDGDYGNMVEIDHGYGLKTRYAHLLSFTVTKGQKVENGSIVGRLGSTGRSTGPHVHYEVRYDDQALNPDGFLRLGAKVGNKPCMVIVCSTQR